MLCIAAHICMRANMCVYACTCVCVQAGILFESINKPKETTVYGSYAIHMRCHYGGC